MVRVFGALILLALIAYLPAFGSGYIFDDHILIENNPNIRQLSNIPQFFISKEARIAREFSGLQDDTYRPLQSASYALDYSLWGDDAGKFHAVNVAIHILNGILVYMLIFQLFRRRALSFLSAALFLIHPVQVEAVTYLSGRADILAALFFLLSLYIYIRPARDGRQGPGAVALSLALFGASLFSKESAAILPLVIFAYAFLVSGKTPLKSSVRDAVKKAFPYLVILIIYLVIRTYNLGKVGQMLAESRHFVVFNMMRVFSEYLKLIFFPLRLTFYHDFDIVPFKLGPWLVLHALVLISYIGLCLYTAKRDKGLAFLLVSYPIALLPVSNIVPIKVLMQERFLYLPSVFILSSISWALVWAGDRTSSTGRTGKIFYFLTIVLIGGMFMLRTFTRNLDWTCQETLVMKEASMHPSQGVFYFDLGVTAFREGRHEKAIEYLEKALRQELSPIHRTMTYDALGNIYNKKNARDRAIGYYQKALEIMPGYVHALNSLGDIYFKRGEYEKARENFARAAEIWPESALFNSNLGCAYIMLGDKEGALKYWRRSLEIDPNQPQVLEFIRRQTQNK